MKIRQLLSTTYLVALAATNTAVFAQDDAAAPPPPPPPPRHGPHEGGDKPPRGERLSPEEREKLRAARDQAMQDESVKAAREKMQSANEELRKVLRPALLSADGSLGPILDKMEKAEKERMDKGPGAGRPPGPPPGDGPRGPMGVLTKEEREKLQAAREKVKDNADVKAAHEKQEAATREFREAMKAAMIAADPSIEPLLEKMREMRPPGGPGGPEGNGGPGAGPRGRHPHEAGGNPPPPPL